jgi:chromosome segregation ATPase
MTKVRKRLLFPCFQATISQLVMENDVLKASLQDSRGLRDSLETEVKSLIEQREESQRRNKDLSHRLDSSEQLKNDTMNQMARLTVQNSRERDEAASLIANLSQKLNAADLVIFESQTQLNSAKKSTEISDATHAEMAQRITSLTEEIILRREESSAAVRERESLRERLRQVTDQLMEADSLKMEFDIQMADGEKQRRQLISQVEELRKSLSEGQEVIFS